MTLKGLDARESQALGPHGSPSPFPGRLEECAGPPRDHVENHWRRGAKTATIAYAFQSGIGNSLGNACLGVCFKNCLLFTSEDSVFSQTSYFFPLSVLVHSGDSLAIVTWGSCFDHFESIKVLSHKCKAKRAIKPPMVFHSLVPLS